MASNLMPDSIKIDDVILATQTDGSGNDSYTSNTEQISIDNVSRDIIATRRWVNYHDSVGSSPSLTNYISTSKIGWVASINKTLTDKEFDSSDRLYIGVNTGRTSNATYTVSPPSGTWRLFEGYGITNFNAGFKDNLTSWPCGAAVLQIAFRIS